MKKFLIILLLLSLYPIPYTLYPNPVYANHIPHGGVCTTDRTHCQPGLLCVFDSAIGEHYCRTPAGAGPAGVFGQISLPPALQNLGVGNIGISQFINNLINLIYVIAIVVFIFMLLFGALEWLTSGGDKEKVASAQRRLVNAFIGIILFAIAFAVLRVLGQFTGFTFFR